jgi:hypothetical protein
MPKRLIVLNALLLALAAGGTVYIVRQLVSPMPMPQAGHGRPAPPAPAPVEIQPPPPGGYASVAARNLFSPTRTETPPTPTVAASPAVKPSLYGIVLREGAPIAYLEDPNTKRVAGYRVGDAVAGGTVQTISADGVVINRSDGSMDVRLHDPAKPRPTPVALPPGAAPGAQPGVAATPMPGVIPPTGQIPGVVPGAQPPVVAPPPGQLVQPGQQPVVPGRRTLPPNLLRRLPQVPQGDAPQQ